MTAAQDKAERHMRETLSKLIEWSIEDSWSYADDFMPDAPVSARAKRLTYLLKRGFAETKKYPHERSALWRITPAGRKAHRAFQEMAA